MKIMTLTEKTTRFNEWLATQPLPEFETKIERQKWWTSKVIEFDQIINSEEWIIVDDLNNQQL